MPSPLSEQPYDTADQDVGEAADSSSGEVPGTLSSLRHDPTGNSKGNAHMPPDQYGNVISSSKRPDLRPNLSPTIRRPSFIGEEEDPIVGPSSPSSDGPSKRADAAPVTWMSLPKKGQLAILTIARLSEPLTERSLAAYMFYQLRSFDSTLPDSTISSQGGMLTASFAAAQFLTAVWWGRAADTPWIGRKRVLLVGLFGTCISCIGVGFSTSFAQALFFRACAGCLNGNVGVMRTMISEIIKEKKYQSRAFLLLPMCFNIGVVIGPILGGFLADPIDSFPGIFGPGSLIGGKDGVRWMKAFPYALPNVVSACFILTSALCVVLGLDETHPALRNRPDYGRRLGRYLVRLFIRRTDVEGYEYEYTQLANNDQLEDQVEMQAITTDEARGSAPGSSSSQPILGDNTPAGASTGTSTSSKPRATANPNANVNASSNTNPTPEPKSPFRQIFTKNVLLTLLTHHLLALHVSAFNALIFLFLPAPRSSNSHARLPFRFSGGLGLSSDRVGLATAIIGVLGFPLQILLYPSLNAKLGTLSSYRFFLPFSVIAYTAIPYLALIPNQPLLVWPALTLVLACQVLSRTFALPSATILVNNCTPHPSVLGTIHGVAQSVSSAARTVGPTLGGYLLGVGLAKDCVGAVWWGVAVVAVCNWCLLWVICEGGGIDK
ncbi:Major facilitator superfamily multidrug transporter mfsB [Exophiala dermatitidis]